MPYAYGLKALATQGKMATQKRQEPDVKNEMVRNSYGYAFVWDSFEDAQFLSALLKAGIHVRKNDVPLKNGGVRWNRGSLFVLKGDNLNTSEWSKKVYEISEAHSQKVTPIPSGYSEAGPDLGSSSLVFIQKPTVGIVRAADVSPYNYGEIWHYFEQQLQYPLMQLNAENVNANTLRGVDVLILPSGRHRMFQEGRQSKALSDWVKQGGPIDCFWKCC